MSSHQEPMERARSVQTMGNVSRSAQQRVDKRVMDIMSRRDGADRRDSPSDKTPSARRFQRRPVASHN